MTKMYFPNDWAAWSQVVDMTRIFTNEFIDAQKEEIAREKELSAFEAAGGFFRKIRIPIPAKFDWYPKSKK